MRVSQVLANGNNYIYRVSKDNIPYVIKGQTILLGEFSKREEILKDVLYYIEESHKEYFNSRILSTLSPHFELALGIDYEVKVSDPLLYLFVEILYECQSEPLINVRKLDIDLVYNVMMQSTIAVSLLHNLNTEYIDINLYTMFYNESKDLLKLIGFSNSSKSGEGMRPKEDGKAPMFSWELPPEVLQSTSKGRYQEQDV